MNRKKDPSDCSQEWGLRKNIRCYSYWVWILLRNWLSLSANRGSFTLGSGFWLHLWDRVSSQSSRRTSCQTTHGTERTDSKKKDDPSHQVSTMGKCLWALTSVSSFSLNEGNSLEGCPLKQGGLTLQHLPPTPTLACTHSKIFLMPLFLMHENKHLKTRSAFGNYDKRWGSSMWEVITETSRDNDPLPVVPPSFPEYN